MELIAEGLLDDLDLLGNYELFFQEYEQGELKLYIDQPLSQELLEKLQDEILTQEVYLTKPLKQINNIITISFEKRIAPLVLIAGAAILIIGGIVAWQIWKGTEVGVPPWVFIIGGAALVYLLLSH